MLVMRKKIYDKINVRFNGYYMMMNTLYYYLFLDYSSSCNYL
jgi:hypothetical protein